MPEDIYSSEETNQVVPKGRSGILSLGRRIREYISLIKAVYDAPDPGSTEYIERQRELVRSMSEKHILSDDPNEAAEEYIRHGDAEFYYTCAKAKKRAKDISKLNGKKVKPDE